MMDEFIHYPKPDLLLSATCDEILSWVIEFWMENHLVSDSNCNTCESIIPWKNRLGTTNDIGLTFSVRDTITAVYN
jgi:hypothetical protein